MLPNVGLMRFPKNTATRSLLVVKSLFVNGEQGAWYDPSDFSTLFQDATGTTPVTAVGQPVGLMLDKRLGLGLGPEMAAATYATAAGFDNVTTPTSISSFSTVGGTTASRVYLNITTVIGKWYKVNVTIGSISSGTVQMLARSGSGGGGSNLMATPQLSAGGSVTLYFAATTTSSSILWVSSAAGASYSVSGISVKLLDGNHATQATTANRPIVGAGFDTYNGTNSHIDSATGGGGTSAFFLCMAITPSGGAGTLRTIWSDAGTNTGYKVQIDAANKLSFSAGNGTAYTTLASTATLNVGTTYLITVWDDGTNLNVQINSAAVESVARPVVSAGTAGFTMGADNGGLASFYAGNMYSSIYRSNANPTAAQRAQAQSYCRAKAGL